MAPLAPPFSETVKWDFRKDSPRQAPPALAKFGHTPSRVVGEGGLSHKKLVEDLFGNPLRSYVLAIPDQLLHQGFFRIAARADLLVALVIRIEGKFRHSFSGISTHPPRCMFDQGFFRPPGVGPLTPFLDRQRNSITRAEI